MLAYGASAPKQHFGEQATSIRLDGDQNHHHGRRCVLGPTSFGPPLVVRPQPQAITANLQAEHHALTSIEGRSLGCIQVRTDSRHVRRDRETGTVLAQLPRPHPDRKKEHACTRPP